MSEYRYRVLIADDEYWSRVNLEKLVSWDEYSMEFLEPACDGREVLERVEKEKPDIVITDINMPFVGGLELLQQLQHDYPDIVTVAVSGYDDFDKVKGAFMAGGIDYLLKPVARQQLADLLVKAVDRVEQNRMRRQQESARKENSGRSSSFVEDSEMSSKLYLELYGTRSKTITAAETTVIPQIFLKFQDVDIFTALYNYNLQQMSYETKKTIRKKLSEAGIPETETRIFCFHSKGNEFLITIPVSRDALRECVEKILEEFPLERYGPITAVIKEQCKAGETLGEDYRKMVSAQSLRPFVKQHVILSADESCLKKTVHISRSLEKNVREAIAAGKKREVRRLVLETSGLSECEKEAWTLFQMSCFLTRIGTILKPESLDDYPSVEEWEEVLDALMYARLRIDLEGIISNLKIMIDLACGEQNDENGETVTDLVDIIYERICVKYYEHFTLSDLSREFHADASYISRTFSKKFGETISGHIARTRIEKAVSLIDEGRSSLEEISFEVGYDDYNYFSRVFKKMTGMRPSEYRDRNREQ